MILTCPDCGVVETRNANARRCKACQFKRNSKRPTRRCSFEHRRAYYQANWAERKAYREGRKAEIAAYMAAYIAADRGAWRARVEGWRKANMAKCNAKTAEWRARRMQATPPWLTEEQRDEMAALYVMAKLLGLHVDHEVPLRGKNVCGLHVPWNLQLLTRADNCRKGNRLCQQAG